MSDRPSEALAGLRSDIAAALASAYAAGAAAAYEDAAVLADGACRAGENCQRDGGCRHVPCLVARQLAAAIRQRAKEVAK